MKVSVREAQRLFSALHELDGQMKQVASGMLREPYKRLGKARYAQAYNLAKLEQILKASTKAMAGLEKEFSVDGVIPKERDEELKERREELLDEEQEVDLRKIACSDLHLDGEGANDIPGTVIAVLLPLIDGFPTS